MPQPRKDFTDERGDETASLSRHSHRRRGLGLSVGQMHLSRIFPLFRLRQLSSLPSVLWVTAGRWFQSLGVLFPFFVETPSPLLFTSICVLPSAQLASRLGSIWHCWSFIQKYFLRTHCVPGTGLGPRGEKMAKIRCLLSGVPVYLGWGVTIMKKVVWSILYYRIVILLHDSKQCTWRTTSITYPLMDIFGSIPVRESYVLIKA